MTVSISDGIFNSKLRYCLPLFCNVWTENDQNQRFTAFTKSDSNKLQVLQNKVLRVMTGLNRYTPTATLLSTSNELSINQMAAFHTLLAVHKAVKAGKPKYISKKLILKLPNAENIFPQRQSNTITTEKTHLSLSKGAFCERGKKLWNSMPLEIRSTDSYNLFKTKMKKWVRQYVPIKPP